MSDQSTPGSAIDFEKRVAQFIAVRSALAAKEKEFEESVKSLKDMKKALEALLLGYLTQTKQEMARTEAGTVSVLDKVSASIEDGAAFRKFCLEVDWMVADLRANATRVEEWSAENDGKPVPGVKLSHWRTVGVRKPT